MKKKHIGRWQRSSIAVLSILLAASSGLTAGAVSYKSLICTAIGGDMYKTVDKQHSEPVVPYPTNGESLEEWKQEADALVEEVESEGIVLLKNEGEVLPLAKGNKLSLFSRSSVDLVLGGTGAGGIDPSKTVDLKTALEEDGEFEVNNTLIKHMMEKTAISVATEVIQGHYRKIFLQQRSHKANIQMQ